MTLFLTGSPTRYGEDHFTEDNGFLAAVKAALAEAVRRKTPDRVGGDGAPIRPRTLLISAAPDDRAFTDSVLEGMSLCIRNSGIEMTSVSMLDRRNAGQVRELVAGADWVILCGGHVPTQNAFIHEIGLRDVLKGYNGVVMGCSAGSMNCADRVYSHPELSGESVDPKYRRWLTGLGLTDINIIPHYYQVRDCILDGRRLFEDIIIPESWQHRFYTFPDGGYIVVRDGRPELHGEAWLIADGSMHRINEENKTYPFMNFVFISPHFPQQYWHFCAALKANGVNVLAVADTNYEDLAPELQGSLAGYYKVRDLENYDEVYRAVAWFAFKFGKIDWIESNNEYWLEQDARLRTDFNVTTGLHTDHISAIKEKSEMKKYYALGGIPTARQIKGTEGEKAIRAFVRKVGFPIIAKPDNGVGAAATYKISSAAELDEWLVAQAAHVPAYVFEEFITGLLVSYDAVYNAKGEPVFESNGVYPTPIMDIVNDNLDSCYYVRPDVPAALKSIGRRTVKAFGIRSRFVHLEFFKLDRDREGLGKKGDYVGLEVNMRPAGGFTPDMMNYAHNTDVYQIWGDMVAYDERRKPLGEDSFCAYASRRDIYTYIHGYDEIQARYGGNLRFVGRMPDALAGALGNQVWIACFPTLKEVEAFFRFVTER